MISVKRWFMGGLGSGKRSHTGYHKTTVSSCFVLNIFKLQRKGLLKSEPVSISWSDNKTIMFAINMRVECNKLTLDYYVNDNKKIEYVVSLTTSPCHYGGERLWFVCPNNQCMRRVSCLYLKTEYFQCRHCLNLTYDCRNENQCDRGYRRARKIRRRLNASMNLTVPTYPWDKPKGMHWSTFDRLVAQADRVTNKSTLLMWQRLSNYVDL